MSVQVRLNGEPDDIAAILTALNTVAEIAGNGRQYPNRSGFGVRVYVEVRLRTGVRVQAERVTPENALGPGQTVLDPSDDN